MWRLCRGHGGLWDEWVTIVGGIEYLRDMEILTVILTAVGSLLGWEGVRWLLTRKSNGRIAEAQADVAEVKAESEEFGALRETLHSMMEMYKEQTQLVRELNRRLIEAEAENARLKAERAMKLCEVRNCSNRQPQSGY